MEAETSRFGNRTVGSVENAFSAVSRVLAFTTLLRCNSSITHNLGGQLKTGQLGSLQNRPTVWPRT
jgi:hypothetical protein